MCIDGYNKRRSVWKVLEIWMSLDLFVNKPSKPFPFTTIAGIMNQYNGQI